MFMGLPYEMEMLQLFYVASCSKSTVHVRAHLSQVLLRKDLYNPNSVNETYKMLLCFSMSQQKPSSASSFHIYFGSTCD